MLFGTVIEFTTVFEAAMISLVVSDKCGRHRPSARERSYRANVPVHDSTSCVRIAYPDSLVVESFRPRVLVTDS
jgi:hypothetical protein